MNPKEIIEYIDSKLKGNVVPLDVERDAIQLIEEYAQSYHESKVKNLSSIVDSLPCSHLYSRRTKIAATPGAGIGAEPTKRIKELLEENSRLKAQLSIQVEKVAKNNGA